ncbi:MAG TPA: FAD-dependent oxidoreductase [Candidatus Limnocylindria bacterium]|nr:FAD-dependent oxidoreductase [Candidatus Limnocylindria bacterium]
MLYSTSVNDPTVVVVGAGVAGLACARELTRRGVATVVLERARGVGGRCATRRIDGQPVDHGVPFLHAQSREFGLALNELDAAGKIPGWPLRVREPRLGCQPDAYRPGHRRLARREGVSAFPKHLASDVDVRLGQNVVALEESGNRIAVRLADGTRIAAPFVVAACALTESLALADPLTHDWPGAGSALEAARRLRTLSSLTVIAGYDPETPELDFDLWHPIEATMIHTLSHDSAKRLAPRDRVLVIQGRPRFSATFLEAPEEEWKRELLWEAAELLGPWVSRPRWCQTHRWRCARLPVGECLGVTPSLESPRGGCVALCGDAFALDSGLEGAYFSGLSLGEQIGTLPRVRQQVRAPQ